MTKRRGRKLKAEYLDAFDMAVHKNVRQGIIEQGIRPDGRKLTEIRPLTSEVHVLPRVHGSSLFTARFNAGFKYCYAGATVVFAAS